jgi:hypothetical protein
MTWPAELVQVLLLIVAGAYVGSALIAAGAWIVLSMRKHEIPNRVRRKDYAESAGVRTADTHPNLEPRETDGARTRRGIRPNNAH